MPIQDSGYAPYAPGHAVEAVIEHGREKGFPEAVDTTFLSRLVSDAYAPRTRKALEHLDLIEEDTGRPTPTLMKIKAEHSDHLQDTLQEWFNEVYQPILTFVSPADDIERITEQFRPYSPDGQRDRMVQLFLSLAAYVGLIESVPKKPRGATSKAAAKKVNNRVRAPESEAPRQPQRDVESTSTPRASSERYLDLLIGLAEKADGDPSSELLDRIERVLGVPRQEERV
ncbi:MAG: DUF5343 domain-containing protein [Acidimicrobiia bacterium]